MPRGTPMRPLLLRITPLAARPARCSSTRTTRSSRHGMTTGKFSSGAMQVSIPQQRFSLISHLLGVCSSTDDEQIVVGDGSSAKGVDRWSANGTKLSSPMPFCSPCYGLFVDLLNDLFCSQGPRHQVLKTSVESPSGELFIVAGTGCAGSSSDRLNNSLGIFVTIHLDLYVADCDNNRVQLFRSGETNATTVAGNGASGTVTLLCPAGIVLDGDGYLYIVDQGNHRLIGFGPAGLRCVAGCSGLSGSASDQLSHPATMSFDRDGNIFVTDRDNSRIQKFSLSSDSCGQQTSGWNPPSSLSSLIDFTRISSIFSTQRRTGQ